MKAQKIKSKVCLCFFLFVLLSSHYAFSSPCQLALEGDLNRDCTVDLADLNWLASCWLTDWSDQPGAFLPDGIYVAGAEWGGMNTAGCGNMAGPCLTIMYGIMRAINTGKNYIFVADGVYTETVSVANGISLWGGFDPMTWVRKEPAQSNTVLIGASSGTHAKTVIANSITAACEVSRFQIKGADAQQPAGNSYAVWIKDSNSGLVFKDNFIYPGRGAGGVDGADGVGGIDGPDGLAGAGASNSMGSVVAGEWIGAAGTSGMDSVSGGDGGGGGGGAFGIFINNTVASAICPSLLNNTIYAGLGGKGGDGGFGGIGQEIGTGGGGGGGAGGIACGIYTRNVTSNPSYQNFNSFVGTNTGGNGGKGGKSFGNSGTGGITGAALNYYYQ